MIFIGTSRQVGSERLSFYPYSRSKTTEVIDRQNIRFYFWLCGIFVFEKKRIRIWKIWVTFLVLTLSKCDRGEPSALPWASVSLPWSGSHLREDQMTQGLWSSCGQGLSPGTRSFICSRLHLSSLWSGAEPPGCPQGPFLPSHTSRTNYLFLHFPDFRFWPQTEELPFLGELFALWGAVSATAKTWWWKGSERRELGTRASSLWSISLFQQLLRLLCISVGAITWTFPLEIESGTHLISAESHWLLNLLSRGRWHAIQCHGAFMPGMPREAAQDNLGWKPTWTSGPLQGASPWLPVLPWHQHKYQKMMYFCHDPCCFCSGPYFEEFHRWERTFLASK